jgi:hypothetical protein
MSQAHSSRSVADADASILYTRWPLDFGLLHHPSSRSAHLYIQSAQGLQFRITSRYDVIIRVVCDASQLPDPITLVVTADQAASSRFASVINLHMADTTISVAAATAPGRYGALVGARAIVSDALKLQISSPIQLGSDARRRAAAH